MYLQLALSKISITVGLNLSFKFKQHNSSTQKHAKVFPHAKILATYYFTDFFQLLGRTRITVRVSVCNIHILLHIKSNDNDILESFQQLVQC